ncbi:MAG: helix-turn-helix domain-containing protein [Epsilonproteobacteria bacterium]|nr:helix-turn-helix domain-containing protein [Campylobacterota bacterium]
MFDFKEMLPKIKDVISAELGDKKVFDKDVADALGINQLTFATMKNRGKIPYEEILNFCAQRRISINWLFYDQATKSLEAQTEKYANVRYFGDVYASAGGGAFNYDMEHDNISLDPHMIMMLGGMREMKNIDSINVLGDSMEPTFRDGDIIFMNRTLDDIRKGGVFVVSTPTGLFVKRLSLKSDGTLDLISDNRQYGVESVDFASVQVVGKVVGSMSGM